jgi:uncharacterized membrane protein SirB2
MDFYSQLKFTHVAAVLMSGLLFLLRGLMVQSGRQELALRAPLRHLSYTIDTILLASALALLTILPGAAYANGWLTVKLALLVVYIVFGALALKRAPTRRARLVFFVAALLTYGYMLSIARAHDPLGLLRAWLDRG